MNQLLSSCEGHFIVGLKDHAYVVSSLSNSVTELVRSSTTTTKPQQEEEALEPLSSSGQAPDPAADSGSQPSEQTSAEEKRQKSDEGQKTDEECNEILAVGITKVDDSTTLWCGVSRGDKTLSIYKLNENDKELSSSSAIESIEPTLVYNTPKRVGCLCFATLPSSSTTTISAPVLVAGDLAGDAHAYSLEGVGVDDKKKRQSRLLLGHTASMLTGIRVVPNRILTADRDEKIRVSSFPDTTVIEGFLLGHEEYVTSIESVPQLVAAAAAGEDGTRSKDQKNLVVSCGGDKTLRLWDLDTLKQVSVVSAAGAADNMIPSDLAVNADGSRIVVIYDQSNRLDVYQVKSDDSNDQSPGLDIDLVQTVSCPSQPLSVAFQDQATLLVLLRDPDYMITFKVLQDDNSVTPEKSQAIETLRQRATETNIVMPETILAKDAFGQPKLKKLQETRGPSGADAPWNRTERVDMMKQRNKRQKKRKQERERENESK
jgi:tRNA (guanine-N(7)-)-methyltransferase subunit TRM82